MNIFKCKIRYISSGSVETDCLAITSTTKKTAILHPPSTNDKDIIDLWKSLQHKQVGEAVWLTRDEFEIIKSHAIIVDDLSKEEWKDLPF